MKVVVPCPWVVDVLGVVSCPPKGKITVGQYVASCAASEKNWATYEIVETLLELGTTKEADQVLKFSTEEDSSNEDRKFLADGSILFFFFFEYENCMTGLLHVFIFLRKPFSSLSLNFFNMVLEIRLRLS